MIPHLKFAHLPTPIEQLPRLSTFLGGPNILVKRDDQTGLAMGGNKTRKLEFLISEAQAHGARTLITAGAVQSNHCRQTAAIAARFGFECTLILTGEPSPYPSGNLLLDELFGAKIIWTDQPKREGVIKQTFEEAWEKGRRPYLIPYGGSNAVGASAYAYAIQELVNQLKSIPLNEIPQWIILPSSSGGTQAGMVVGAYLFGFQGKILGISVDEQQEVLQTRVANLATTTTEYLGSPHTFIPQDILVNTDYLGDGYGVMGEAEKEAIQLFARTEGLLVDPVYTGRAAAGMIDLIRKQYLTRGETVLFWHTGGTPALFADKYQSVIK